MEANFPITTTSLLHVQIYPITVCTPTQEEGRKRRMNSQDKYEAIKEIQNNIDAIYANRAMIANHTRQITETYRELAEAKGIAVEEDENYRRWKERLEKATKEEDEAIYELDEFIRNTAHFTCKWYIKEESCKGCINEDCCPFYYDGGSRAPALRRKDEA